MGRITLFVNFSRRLSVIYMHSCARALNEKLTANITKPNHIISLEIAWSLDEYDDILYSHNTLGAQRRKETDGVAS